MTKGRSIFITATDTGVGKTLISGLLLQFLAGRAINCGYQKWASSGSAAAPADLASCLRKADIPPDPQLLDLQVPYRFDFPGS
ncbi:MAG: AAA family ATPase, partial [Desulfurivibrionaceae bacterium]|nr:AAA family ATPase [Desulfurivibrionaceae bacterium]